MYKKSRLKTIATGEQPWRLLKVKFDHTKAVFTAQCHASAVYATVVCLSVCLSQVGVLLKQLNTGSCKQCHTKAQGLFKFSDAEDLGKTQMGSPPIEAPNAGGLHLVASLSYFACSMFAMMQCIARVRQQQLTLVIILISVRSLDQ